MLLFGAEDDTQRRAAAGRVGGSGACAARPDNIRADARRMQRLAHRFRFCHAFSPGGEKRGVECVGAQVLATRWFR